MADAGVCRWRGCSVCAASSTRRWARAAAAFRNTTRPRCRPSSTGCTRPPATSSSSKRISTWRPTSSSTSVPCLAGFFSLLFLFTFQTALFFVRNFYFPFRPSHPIPLPIFDRLGFLPSFTGFYRILLGFIGIYRVLPGLTGFYWVLYSLTRLYWDLPGLTGFDLGFTGFYRVLLGFTGFYLVLPGFTRL